MAGPSNRPTILRRRGLAFPAGYALGLDSSHPLASNLVLSSAVVGKVPQSILPWKAAASVSTLVYKLDGILGPICTYVGAGSLATFPAPTTISTNFALAAFFKPTTSIASGFIFCTDTTNLAGYGLVSDSLVVKVFFLTAGTLSSSAITMVLNNPYFIVASGVNGGTVNFAVRNLLTGKLQTASVAAGTATLTGGSGTLEIGTGPNNQADGSIGPVVWSQTALSLPTLRQIASDPWEFWYPSPAGLALENELLSPPPASATSIGIVAPYIFGPGRGPSRGMNPQLAFPQLSTITALTIDSAGAFESLSNQRFDSTLYDEIIASLRRDAVIADEVLSGLLAFDAVPADEVLAGVRSDSLVGLETTAAFRSDTVVAEEFLEGLRTDSDGLVAAEILAGVRNDAVLTTEILSGVRSDSEIAAEIVGNLRSDSVLAEAIDAGVRSDSVLADEILAGFRSDSAIADETLGLVAVTSDGMIQVESTGSMRSDSAIAAESLVGVRSEQSFSQEILAGVQANVAMAAEIISSSRTDSGTNIETTARMSADSVSFYEFGVGVTADGSVRAEVLAQARFDAAPALEILSSVFVVSGDSIIGLEIRPSAIILAQAGGGKRKKKIAYRIWTWDQLTADEIAAVLLMLED